MYVALARRCKTKSQIYKGSIQTTKAGGILCLPAAPEALVARQLHGLCIG